jgi:crossover junction endodeoxyribonuclease RuvC
MLIIGIDPGLDGAFALYDSEQRRVLEMISIPVLKLTKGKGTKREISPHTLLAMLRDQITGIYPSIDRAFIERVQSSPQMGVTSAFNFGRGYGAVEGVIASMGWAVEYVVPAKWKRFFALRPEKDEALQRACQLLPLDTGLWLPQRGVVNQQQCYGRAEAALIAVYGAKMLGSPEPKPTPVPVSGVLASAPPDMLL